MEGINKVPSPRELAEAFSPELLNDGYHTVEEDALVPLGHLMLQGLFDAEIPEDAQERIEELVKICAGYISAPILRDTFSSAEERDRDYRDMVARYGPEFVRFESNNRMSAAFVRRPTTCMRLVRESVSNAKTNKAAMLKGVLEPIHSSDYSKLEQSDERYRYVQNLTARARNVLLLLTK